jgi:hypothetical protein
VLPNSVTIGSRQSPSSVIIARKTVTYHARSSTICTKTNSHWTNSVADKPATLRELASPNVMKFGGKYVKVAPISQVQNAGLRPRLREQFRLNYCLGTILPLFSSTHHQDQEKWIFPAK